MKELRARAHSVHLARVCLTALRDGSPPAALALALSPAATNDDDVEGAERESMDTPELSEVLIWSRVLRASGLRTGDGRDLVAVAEAPAATATAAWAAATSLFPLCMSSLCRVECRVGPT